MRPNVLTDQGHVSRCGHPGEQLCPISLCGSNFELTPRVDESPNHATLGAFMTNRFVRTVEDMRCRQTPPVIVGHWRDVSAGSGLPVGDGTLATSIIELPSSPLHFDTTETVQVDCRLPRPTDGPMLGIQVAHSPVCLDLGAAWLRGKTVETVCNPRHASLTVDEHRQHAVDIEFVEQWWLLVGP